MQDVARRISGINAEPFDNVRLRRCHQAPEEKRNYQLALTLSHDCSCWNIKTAGMLEQKTRYGTFLLTRLAR
jgi:hypothetical protein